MMTEVEAKLVTIYVNSSDRWAGRPLYAAIVQSCRGLGIAGATVTRCIEGYGASGENGDGRAYGVGADVPLRIEIIDVPDRIDVLLEALSGMMGEGLVAVQDVHAYKYRRERAVVTV